MITIDVREKPPDYTTAKIALGRLIDAEAIELILFVALDTMEMCMAR